MGFNLNDYLFSAGNLSAAVERVVVFCSEQQQAVKTVPTTNKANKNFFISFSFLVSYKMSIVYFSSEGKDSFSDSSTTGVSAGASIVISSVSTSSTTGSVLATTVSVTTFVTSAVSVVSVVTVV